jgi:hypothetical protein
MQKAVRETGRPFALRVSVGLDDRVKSGAVMADPEEVCSVAEFQRDIQEYVGRIKESRTAVILTVDGQAQLVVQDAASYHDLVSRLEAAEAITAIRRGLEQADRGEGIELGEAADRLRARHDFSR